MKIKDSYLFFLIISIIAGIFLRLYGLNIQSFWYDELVTAATASYTNIIDFLTHFLAGDVHPPLYYAFLHYWIKLFGNSETVFRLPSALAGILTVFVMYFMSKKIFGRYAAAGAAILTALSGTAIYYSQEARSYAVLILFSAITTFLWLNIITNAESEKIENKKLALYGITGLITVYLHYFGTALIYLQLIYLFIVFIINKRSIKKLMLLSYLITLLFSLWFIPHVLCLRSFNGTNFGLVKQNWRVLFELADLIFTKNIVFLIFLPLILGLKNYIKSFKLFASRINLSNPITALLYIALVPVIIFCSLSQFTAILYPRYLLIIMPAVYMLISVFVTSNPLFSGNKGVLYIFAVSVLGLYLYMFPLFHGKGTYYEPHKQQWREAAAYIKRNITLKNTDETIILNDRSAYLCGYYFNFFRNADSIYKVKSSKNKDTEGHIASKKYKRIFVLSNFQDIPNYSKVFLILNNYRCSTKEYTDLFLNDCSLSK